MKINKKAILIFLVLVAVLSGGVLFFSYQRVSQPKTWAEISKIPPEHMKVDERKPLREQTRTIEFAGRMFKIPIMYLDTPLDKGVKQNGLLLEVIWPEMRSIYELKDRAEYERIWKVEKRRGWILLEPAAVRPTLDVQVSNMQNSMTKFESAGHFDGLEKYLWYRGTAQSPELQHEVYLKRNEKGNIIVYIDCSRGPNARFPTCGHKFINNGLIYDISYNEAVFLSDWREQQRRAMDFMESFSISSDIPEATRENK